MEQTEHLHQACLPECWVQFCAGDQKAFGEVVALHYAALDHYGTRFTEDRDLIKDCLQDLFLQIWEKRECLAHVVTLKPYLFQSLRNNLLHRIRKQSFFSDITQNELDILGDISPESNWILQETEMIASNRLKDAIQHLPKRQREALYLKYYQNLSYEDIAEVMGLNRQAIANYLQYGIQKLRGHLLPTTILLSLILNFIFR